MASYLSAEHSPEFKQLLYAPEPKIHLAPAQPESSKSEKLHPDVARQRGKDLFWFLVGWRLFNAVTVGTFFQPDEYFQALEPAWQLAFGEKSGAWMTWEWSHQLRSSIHPIGLALVYTFVSGLCWISGFPTTLRVQLLILAPKFADAFVAATLDYYTWRLGERILGDLSTEAHAALTLSIFSPWQWFASTRSLVNGIEASLTVAALVHWPWSWMKERLGAKSRQDDHSKLKLCVVLACTATLLRPTNLLIWISLTGVTAFSAAQEELVALAQEASIIGTATLAVANGLDRLYYGNWTFPAANFLQFNLFQDLAVFYGRNRPDYYLTEGLPTLLTTAAPFAIAGIYQALRTSFRTGQEFKEDKSPGKGTSPLAPPSSASSNSQKPLLALAVTAILYTTILSLIPHKEVRFLHPLLPILLTLAAPAITHYFRPFPSPTSTSRTIQLYFLLAFNIVLATYVTHFHARGVLTVLSYLRDQFTAINAPELLFGNVTAPSLYATLYAAYTTTSRSKPITPITFQDFGLAGIASTAAFPVTMETPLRPLTVAFLMPCHSTPWRSHLVYTGIKAWALTCEPPVNVTDRGERERYLDEADVFYADPARWLTQEMSEVPTNKTTGVFSQKTELVAASGEAQSQKVEEDEQGVARDARGKRLWPQYVVFFEQLEPLIKRSLGDAEGSRYGECWRGFNTQWHDDWRRKGDVIVWCVDGGLDVGEAAMSANGDEDGEHVVEEDDGW